MTLHRIISGGQTGVDIAALDAAREMGIYEWGGWCPKGRLQEFGQISDEYFNPDRESCGMKEAESSRWAQRTALNVRDSDATLILKTGHITTGTKLTIKICRQKSRYYVICDPYKPYHVPRAVKFIIEQNVKILNVAGPRESRRKGIYKQSKTFLTDVFHFVFQFQKWGIKIWDPKHKEKKI